MTLGKTYINWPKMEETRDFNSVKFNFKDFQVTCIMPSNVCLLTVCPVERFALLMTDKTSYVALQRGTHQRVVYHLFNIYTKRDCSSSTLSCCLCLFVCFFFFSARNLLET